MSVNVEQSRRVLSAPRMYAGDDGRAGGDAGGDAGCGRRMGMREVGGVGQLKVRSVFGCGGAGAAKGRARAAAPVAGAWRLSAAPHNHTTSPTLASVNTHWPRWPRPAV